MTQFKPMLAKDADFNKLRFPLLASPKLDGVRATVINGVVMSRSMKPIPNKYIQQQFKGCEYFDGELIVGDPTSKFVYRDTVSEVMSFDKQHVNGATFYVFDHIQFPAATYEQRRENIKQALNNDIGNNKVKILEQLWINNLDELKDYENSCLELGFEGIITRDPLTAYKFGRSTTNSQELQKIKRFADAEAWVIGFDERMHNGNEAFTNELGRTSRSSHQENKVPMNTLGALVCDFKGTEFRIGTGFDDDERQEIWNNKDKYLDGLVKFKYFPVGTDLAPRHPVFLGWRDGRDV